MKIRIRTRKGNKKGLLELPTLIFSIILFAFAMIVFYFIFKMSAASQQIKVEQRLMQLDSNDYLLQYLQYPADSKHTIADVLRLRETDPALYGPLLTAASGRFVSFMQKQGTFLQLRIRQGSVTILEMGHAHTFSSKYKHLTETQITMPGYSRMYEIWLDGITDATPCDLLKSKGECTSRDYCAWTVATQTSQGICGTCNIAVACESYNMNYNKQELCKNDPCYVGRCSWDGTNCVTK